MHRFCAIDSISRDILAACFCATTIDNRLYARFVACSRCSGTLRGLCRSTAISTTNNAQGIASAGTE